MSAAVDQPVPASTYGDAWPVLRADGWTGTLPLRPGTKFPPPQDHTGWDGPDPSSADCQSWADEEYRGTTQLALRMPAGVIGIDVDAYGHKRGRWTLQEAVRRWGPLPAGPSSSARDDGTSGISFYRVPPGTVLVSNIKFPELPDTLDDKGDGGIEVIQRHHRYAVVWPSIHPSGAPYTWRSTIGPGINPRVDELPMLPASWVGGLAAQAEHFVRRGSFPEANALIHAMPAGQCVTVANALNRALGDLRGSRHDDTTRHVMRLLRLGEQGHKGVPDALDALDRAFVVAIADRSTEREALAEFDRMVYGGNGIGQLLANPTAPSDYGCRHAPEAPPLEPRVAAASTATAPLVTVDQAADDWSDVPAGQPEPGLTTVEQKWLVDVWNEQYKLKVRDEAARLHRIEQRKHRPAIRDGVIHDLDAITPPTMLLGSLIPDLAIGFLAGRSGAYKSFLATSWACCIATGLPWMGRAEFGVTRPLKTLYVAAEGAGGAAGRIRAWEAANAASRLYKLALYARPIHLNDQDQAQELAEYVAKHHIEFVVVDTYHRSAPGTEENSSTDFGAVFEAVARLRDDYGCGILFVDHTGHSGERLRGTSAKGDDADYVLLSSYDGESRGPEIQRTLSVSKLKDEESSGEWPIRLAAVPGAAFPVAVVDDLKAIENVSPWGDQLRWPVPADVMTLEPKAAKDGRARGRAGIVPVAMYMREHAPAVENAVGLSRSELTKAISKDGGLSEATVRNAWSALVEHGRLQPADGVSSATGRHVWLHQGDDPVPLD